MPKKHKSPTSIDADTLRQWQRKGADSEILRCRLQWIEAEGFARYARMMTEDRIFPSMLPTQASGRWSTTDPPLVNFPPSMDDVITPDPGYWWLAYDLDAIEAKISSAYSRDKMDLEAFEKGWDIHTLTACTTYHHAMPPIRTKACHTSDECAAWRASWSPPWDHDSRKPGDDRRRHLVKTMRYALQYSPETPEGYYSVLGAKDVEKLGLSRDELLKEAKAYLDAKPALRAAKNRVYDEAIRTKMARTFLGRRRPLYSASRSEPVRRIEMGKIAWSHMVSGSVTDIMNLTLIKITNAYPDCHLVVNKHDGLILAFPDSLPQDEVVHDIKTLVEQPWDINGAKIISTAEYKVILPVEG